LSFLNELTKLEGLDLSNNPFYGSLKPLRNCNKLELLDITNTDIDSGLGYLTKSLEKIYGSGKLAEVLESCKRKNESKIQ